jgi:hypothetical protein
LVKTIKGNASLEISSKERVDVKVIGSAKA